MIQPQSVVALMGPTASGKTDLALEIARHFPCEIISVDSALVYRGLDIGTAKPATALRAAVPHHLIDIRDPSESYSAADFCRDAHSAIADILARGRVPLLVGGTMLYFQALLFGLSELPAADPELRLRLDADASRLGWAAMHQRLAAVDPVAAKRIHPNDPQRIQRALEVYELTGEPWSRLCAAERNSQFPYRLSTLIIAPSSRSLLHERIEQRFKAMLEQGLLAEVAALRARGDLTLQLPALRTVGYRQVWLYLDGEYDYAEMFRRAVAATRQLAKRQITWLRRDWGGVRLNSDAPDFARNALNFLRGVLI